MPRKSVSVDLKKLRRLNPAPKATPSGTDYVIEVAPVVFTRMLDVLDEVMVICRLGQIGEAQREHLYNLMGTQTVILAPPGDNAPRDPQGDRTAGEATPLLDHGPATPTAASVAPEGQTEPAASERGPAETAYLRVRGTPATGMGDAVVRDEVVAVSLRRLDGYALWIAYTDSFGKNRTRLLATGGHLLDFYPTPGGAV